MSCWDRNPITEESNNMNKAAVLSLLCVTGLACTAAFAADKKPQASERSVPLDRSGYFDKGAATTDDLRRVAMPAGFNDLKTSFVIRNARLFDGTGAPARPATVIVVGNKISKVLPADSTEMPKDAEVIDAGGATVMPGLIDMHVHMTYVFDRTGMPELTSENQADAALRGMERLRYFVESGITSVRDTAGNGLAPFILKDWADQGHIASPRVFPVGQLITGTGGHADELFIQRTAPEFEGSMIRVANGPDEWREAVRTQFKRGADWIKIASHFDEDEVQMAVKEAHQLGLRITVDSENVFTDMAVKAGVDCVEHPLPRSDETVKLMAARGIASIPTIVPYQIIIQNYGGYYGTTSRRFSLTEPHMFEMVKKMKDAGVKLGVGTDIVNSWYRRMPGPYIQELHNFEKIGYKPEETLIAATRTNAEILGMADRLGTIEPGKLADLIIVDGKPDANVDDLAKVRTVMVGGRIFKRDGRIEQPPRFPDPEEKAATNPRKMD
jgi:imidazolonepropionase-like amidohydrolase